MNQMKVTAAIKNLCLGVGMCLLLFVLLEGLSSTAFALYKIFSATAPARALAGPHLQYDRELGWVSVPNFHAKNYYAPGIDLNTNSKGFRANEEFTDRVPPGKLRIVCNGDSQTFGDGAGNDHTWCHVLESLDGRLQTVNISEIGYGADQMYLRFKRSGASLDNDVHLFAIVTDDFLRMRRTAMGGYGKPVLKLQDGQLTTGGQTTIERGSALFHFLALKPNPLRQFRSVEVAADTIDWAKSGKPVTFDGPSDEERRILGKMIESMQQMERNGGMLVLVYIPTRNLDYTPGGPSEPWRTGLKDECAKRGVPVVDLIDNYRKLPVTTRDGLFIWPGATENFAESIGHFSDQGHEYIAKQVYAGLAALPEFGAKLAALTLTQDR